jgi:hypothetical protein
MSIKVVGIVAGIMTAVCGCASEEATSRKPPAGLEKIINVVSSGREHGLGWTNKDREALYDQVGAIVVTYESPDDLERLVVASMTYQDARCNGPCLVCEMIGSAYEHCLTKLKELGTDESIRTLVYLRINKECRWDASASVLLSHVITSCGPRAIPYLKEIQSSYSRAKELIRLIKQGRLYGP